MSQENNRPLKSLSTEALSALAAYNWPGNVRELENRVKRAVIMAEGQQITPADLDLKITTGSGAPMSLKEARERAEREVVQHALLQVDGNVTQAAKLLNVSRPTLYDLMRSHNIKV
jgi:two-component system NtrC family response regulator